MHSEFKSIARIVLGATIICLLLLTGNAIAISGYKGDIDAIKEEETELLKMLNEHASVSEELAKITVMYKIHAVAQYDFFQAQIDELAACEVQISEYDIIAEEDNDGQWTDQMEAYVNACFERTGNAKKKVGEAAEILGEMEKEVKKLRLSARVRERDAITLQASLSRVRAQQAEMQARIDQAGNLARLRFAESRAP